MKSLNSTICRPYVTERELVVLDLGKGRKHVVILNTDYLIV